MKNLNYIFMTIFSLVLIFNTILGCNLFLYLPTGDKFEYLEEKPVNIFVDGSNNGLIVFKDRICKIKNLYITNETINLKDSNTKLPIIESLYNVNKLGDGVLIYSRAIYDGNRIIIPETNEKFSTLYSIRISKNEFLFNTKRELNKNLIIKYIGSITNFLEENYGIYYIDINKDVTLTLENINNEKINSHKLNESFIDKSLLGINFNSNGDGWYFYWGRNNKDGGFKIFSLKNYEKKEEKLKEELDEQLKDNGNNLPFLKANFDENGTGYILSAKLNFQTNQRKLVVQKFENFQKTTEKLLVFESDEIYNKPTHSGHYPNSIIYYKPFIYINKEGNGIILMTKKGPKENESLYTYTKKIINFKVENRESKLFDSNKFNYYDFSINDKGNGFVILTNQTSSEPTGKEQFIVKKIINYELEN